MVTVCNLLGKTKSNAVKVRSKPDPVEKKLSYSAMVRQPMMLRIVIMHGNRENITKALFLFRNPAFKNKVV